MCYMKPFLMTFGGNVGSRITNDIFLINIDDGIFEWKKLEPQGEIPCSRMYHASSVCKYGGACGMMIVYGGRGESSNALNDTWGLRKHRNGTWDWLKAPYSNNYSPLKRYQHSMAFYYNFMVVLGGRTDDDLKNIPIEIYDTESSEWTELAFFNKFRHSSWIVDNGLYTHGGFDYISPMISKNDLVMIDIIKLMNTTSNLTKKLDKLNDMINKTNKNSSDTRTNTNSTNPNTNLNISTNSGNSQSASTSKNPTPNISPTNTGNNNNQMMQNQSLGKYNNGNPANNASSAEAQLNMFSKLNINGKKGN